MHMTRFFPFYGKTNKIYCNNVCLRCSAALNLVFLECETVFYTILVQQNIFDSSNYTGILNKMLKSTAS